MKKLADLPGNLRGILDHPLNRGRKGSALWRWVRWQAGSRLARCPVVIPFVADTVLVGAPGMTGMTGNVYCGLAEFEDMGLALHLLRPDHLFVDVGASVGVYTVLASGGAGARTVACEPVPVDFETLRENIRLNDLGGRVEAHRVAIGSRQGTLRLTSTLHTMNHVVGDAAAEGTIEVEVRTLDGVLAGRAAALIKVDVEGYEMEVLRGAEKTLGDSALLAAIIEVGGAASRYGHTATDIVDHLRGFGFVPFAYDPLTRRLTKLDGPNTKANNTIFVRDPGTVAGLLETAPRRRVHGTEI